MNTVSSNSTPATEKTATWHAPTITHIDIRKTMLLSVSFVRFKAVNKI